MKKLISLFIMLVFLFSGCVQKERVVYIKMPEQGLNNSNFSSNTNSSLDSVAKNETKEEITALEPMENNTPIVENNSFKPLEGEEITDESKIKNLEQSSVQEGQAIVEELPGNTNTQQSTQEPQEGQAIMEDLPGQGDTTLPVASTSGEFNIAVLYSSKFVSKYANSAVNTITGYMSFRKKSYKVKSIDTSDESLESIKRAFDEVKKLGITNVIALYTPNAKYNLSQADVTGLRVYLPLIDSKFSTLSANFIYGSISYEAQIQRLSQFSNGNNAMFYQQSYLGNKLKTQTEMVTKDIRTSKEIQKNTNDFKYLVNDSKINNSTLFLNTDPVKTSIILAQLRAYSIKPHVVLSTQINYDFAMTKLTQVEDRNDFIIASSIGNVDVGLIDEISTFGGDVVFEWVDYSTLVGVDYLFDGNSSGLIDSKVEGNSAVYNTRLFKLTETGFSEIK